MMSDPTSIPLLSHDAATFPLDSRRYYVLLLFAFLGTQQCYCWYTFASMPTQTANYFGLSQADGDAFVDLTLSYGGMIFLIAILPCMWALGGRKGLQIVMRVSGGLTFTCGVLRCLPCLLYPNDPRKRHDLLWLLHLAQILNAAAGATYLSAGSRISAVWFPPQKRTFATAVALMGGNLGMMIGYGFGAWFSSSADGMAQILYVELGISAMLFILVVMNCPIEPESREFPMQSRVSSEDEDLSIKFLAKDVWRVLKIPAMIFLLLAGGVESGSNAAWGGLLPQIFETRFDSSSADSLANLCGLLNCTGSLIGMLAGGWVADRFFQRRLKQLMLIYFSVEVLLTAVVTAMFPTPWTPVLWEAAEWEVAFIMTIAGGFQGCLDPLFVELAAEITYPTKEGTSGGLSMIALNIAGVVVLLLAPVLPADMMNTIYTLCLVACVLFTLCCSQRYLRSENECLRSK